MLIHSLQTVKREHLKNRSMLKLGVNPLHHIKRKKAMWSYYRSGSFTEGDKPHAQDNGLTGLVFPSNVVLISTNHDSSRWSRNHAYQVALHTQQSFQRPHLCTNLKTDNKALLIATHKFNNKLDLSLRWSYIALASNWKPQHCHWITF